MCANVPAEFCNLVNNVTYVLYAHIEKSRTHPRKSEVIKSTVKQTVNRLMEAVCWSDAEQMSWELTSDSLEKRGDETVCLVFVVKG